MDWSRLEIVYFLLVLVVCVAIFFGLYANIGVTDASILTLIVAFIAVLFGYILFVKSGNR
ncbi:MAG: hypothetical protein ABR909_00065 [Candidatus Bathyarchaeia archaeon]